MKNHFTLALLVGGCALSGVASAQLSPSTQKALNRLYEEKIESMNAEYSPFENVTGAESQHNEAKVNGSGTTHGAEMSVAVNPTDHDNVVTSYMENSTSLDFPLFYSNDRGTTWNRSTFDAVAIHAQNYPNEMIAGGGDPVFEFDAQGTAYFSWIYLTIQNGQFDTAFMRMFWAKSVDGGQSWTHTKSMKVGEGAMLLSGGFITGIAQYGDGVFDRQWFDVDRSGGTYSGRLYSTTYVIPHGGNSLVEGMLVSYVNPGDSVFQRGDYAGTGTTQFGNIVVNQSTGAVNVTYINATSNQVLFTSSTDGGQTFGTPVTVATGSNLFPSGSTVHSRENSAPSLAIGGNGNLYLAWSDFAGGQVQSYFSMSTDDGATWSTAADLTTLAGISGTPFMPTVAASGGLVCVSYYNLDASKRAYYEYAYSNDNGATFNVGDTLSSDATPFGSFSSSAFFGDYNRSVMKGNTLYTTWSDGRSGVPQPYIAIDDLSNKIGLEEYSAITPEFNVGRAFPNPASTTVKFEVVSEIEGNLTVEVFATSGQVVSELNQSFNAGEHTVEVNTSEWNSGMYFVRFTLDNGVSYMRKVQVTH